MKIMTFNTQHCLWYTCKKTGKVKPYNDRKIELERFAQVIKDSGADIVGLNEMYESSKRGRLKKQVTELKRLTGYDYCYFGEAIKIDGVHSYGNGFLSKIPIISAETILIPDPTEKKHDKYYETRCLIKLTLKNGFTVLVTHFGLNEDEQENATRTVLSNIVDKKCILMGDFNLTPDNHFVRRIASVLTDTEQYMKGNVFTYPSVDAMEKIDYIFVSKDVKIKGASVWNVIASDHLPITAEVDE